jgi:putative transposase
MRQAVSSRMAQQFGDHPEAAVDRMRWVRQLADKVSASPAPPQARQCGRRVLRSYETHHNQHRPHRSLHGAAPLKPLPEPVNPDHYRVRRHAHVAGLINEYRLVA